MATTQQPSPQRYSRPALSVADVISDPEIILRCLNAQEFFQASAVCSSWQRCVQGMWKNQKWYFWSQIEGRTRGERHITLQDEPAWKDAFLPRLSPSQSAHLPLSEDDKSDDESDDESEDEPQSQPSGYRLCIEAAVAFVHTKFSDEGVRYSVAELMAAVRRCFEESVVETVDDQFEQPGWHSLSNMWTRLFVVVCLYGTTDGIPKLIGELWNKSHPMSSKLPRHQLREFLSAVLVLMRYPEWERYARTPRSALQQTILTELLYQEEQDVRAGTVNLLHCPDWRHIALPVPSCYVDLGKPLSTQQVSLIQTAVPFEVKPAMNGIPIVYYRRPLPNVAHKIVALAGSGKTTTLRAFALAHRGLSFLYTCYNKEGQLHAESVFPNNVACRTTHSLAGQKRNWLFANRNKMIRFPYTSEMMNSIRKYQGKAVSYAVLGVIRSLLDTFLASTDTQISLTKHLPPTRKLPLLNHPPDYAALANHIYKHMINPMDPMDAPHNAYLKLFVLDKPILKASSNNRPYDCILVDESQDLNPLTLELIMLQPHTKIFVGDPFQHIYSFNHCCSTALTERTGNTRQYTLNTTFRMAMEVGTVANRLLCDTLRSIKPLLAIGPLLPSCVYTPKVLQPPPDPTPASPADSDMDPSYSQSQSQSQSYINMLSQGSSQPLSQSQPSSQYTLSQLPGLLPESSKKTVFVQTPLRHQSYRPSGWPAELPTMHGLVQLPVDPRIQRRPLLTYVCRTNGEILKAAAALAVHGVRFSTSMEPEMLPKAAEVYRMKHWNTLWGPRPFREGDRLSNYKTYHEFIEALESGLDIEWAAVRMFVESMPHGLPDVLGAIESMADGNPSKRNQHEYYLTTGHKVKGQEYDYVQIADDFVTDLCSHDKYTLIKPQRSSDDEYNLLYVAATRAKHVLFANEAITGLLKQPPRLTIHKRSLSKLQRSVTCTAEFVGNALPGVILNNFFVGDLTYDNVETANMMCALCLQGHHVKSSSEKDVYFGDQLVCQRCAQETWLASLASESNDT